jgi:hypothetical protein
MMLMMLLVCWCRSRTPQHDSMIHDPSILTVFSHSHSLSLLSPPRPCTCTLPRACSSMSDPLDDDDFDPIEYINRHFPSEASLVELDTFMVGISSKISGLDDEISRAVQGQSRAGEQATRVSVPCPTSKNPHCRTHVLSIPLCCACRILLMRKLPLTSCLERYTTSNLRLLSQRKWCKRSARTLRSWTARKITCRAPSLR